jgi:hypothetical protein
MSKSNLPVESQNSSAFIKHAKAADGRSIGAVLGTQLILHHLVPHVEGRMSRAV